jgi:uncharacterized protein (TIGR02147 family)
MKIFTFESYKQYVLSRVRAMPSGGKGQFKRMAQSLGVHTSLLSQVFRGEKNLTPEQAHGIARYLGLSESETDYFIELVQLARAGSNDFRRYTRARLEKLRREAEAESGAESPLEEPLSERNRVVFYSNWYYSGIRILTSIPAFQDLDAISEYLQLPKALVSQVMDFLVSSGLCVKQGERIGIGPRHTELRENSPLVARHHLNWRFKAIERMPRVTPSELFYTSPLSISEADAPEVRKILVEAIERVSRLLARTKPEKAACLSIDWFDF